MEKALVGLEEAARHDEFLAFLFAKRPDVEGFRCTILGTFRIESLRARCLTPDVLVEMTAAKVKGRLCLFNLLLKRVKLSAKAGELTVRVIPSLGSPQRLCLRDASLRIVSSRSEGTTRIGLSSAAVAIGDENGERFKFRGIMDREAFVLEGAELDMGPGTLLVKGKVTRGEFRYFDVQLQAADLRLGRLASISDFVDGVVSGEADAKGELRSGLVDGEATLRVTDGMVKEPVLERFGELEALSLLAFGDGASGSASGIPFRSMDISLFTNAAGVTFRSLNVSGEGYTLAGTGFVSLAGGLSFLLRGQVRDQAATSITVGGDIFSPQVSWMPISGSSEGGLR